MNRTETPQSKLKNFFNETGFHFIERRIAQITYRGEENIVKGNETLLKGGSVLLVADHPGTLATIDAASVMLLFPNRKHTAAMVKEELTSGELGFSSVVVETFSRYQVEPLAVRTPKYHEDNTATKNFNAVSARRGMTILYKIPGSALLTFASGTRSHQMREAEPGLGGLSPFSDTVLPLTTINERGKPIVIIHEPIPGKPGVSWCVKNLGKEQGRQAFSDLVMTIIASGQPDKKKQGFYEVYCEALEKFLWSGTMPEDPRLQNMLKAYEAWDQGAFV